MREMKDSGVKSIGEIPACWCTRKFKTLAKLCNGREVSIDEGVIPVYGSGGIFKYTDKPLHSGESLLLGRKGTIDNPMIVEGEFWTVDTMFYTSAFHDVLGKYMYYCFKGAVDYGFYKSGSVLPSMTQTEINGISLPYPPLPEQHRIADLLDTACSKVDALIANQQAQIEKLKAYKQSLITEVVTHGLDPNAPMKDSGVEWIGMIPQGWEVNRGKFVLKLLSRKVINTDEVITCFRDGEVTLRRNRREEGFTFSDKEIGYQGIEPGDLVVHGMDGFAGAIGISDSRGKGSPILIVCDSEHSKKYMVYYLRNLAYRNIFIALATGIRVRSCDLRWNKLAVLPFVLPPIPEQQQIADYLDDKCTKIDALIAIKQQKIEKLGQYKKSLIYEYVTGKKEA